MIFGVRHLRVPHTTFGLLFKKGGFMTPKIFNLPLSDETISLFFLIEGLSTDRQQVSTREMFRLWNSTDLLLNKGLEELQERNVIRKIASNGSQDDFYRIISDYEWQYDN